MPASTSSWLPLSAQPSSLPRASSRASGSAGSGCSPRISSIGWSARDGSSGPRPAGWQLQPLGSAEPLEEAPVVRDEQDRAVERVQGTLQLLDRRNVEMVRRLVEDQEVDASCG